MRITRVVGLEVANSSIKVVTKQEGWSYLNTLTKITRTQLNEMLNFTTEDVLTYEGEQYVVGLPTGQGSGGVSNERYKSMDFKTECALAISKLVKTPNEDIKVVTGVPAIEFDNTEIIDAIRKNLVGKYEVLVGNISRKFEITDVLIIPQPVGTLLNHFFTKDLKQKVKDDELLKDWLVIDIGWGTVDICIANASNGVSHMDTYYKGMSNVFHEMLLQVNKAYPKANVKRIIKSAYQLAKLVERDNFLMLNDVSYNIESIKNQRFEEFTDDIYHYLINNSYDLETANILITGGGGLLLYNHILNTFLNSRIALVDNPVLANAVGFYILGGQRF